MANKLKTLATALIHYYSAPLTQSFRSFRNGLIYFCFGMGLIYLAHTHLQPSLKQELITLVGLGFVALGFFMAMMAHIHMLISRLVKIFTKK